MLPLLNYVLMGKKKKKKKGFQDPGLYNHLQSHAKS